MDPTSLLLETSKIWSGEQRTHQNDWYLVFLQLIVNRSDGLLPIILTILEIGTFLKKWFYY